MNLSRSKEFTGDTLSHLYFHKFNPRSKDSVKHDDIIRIYSGGDKTSVKTLTAYISHNKAKDPINLGAK